MSSEHPWRGVHQAAGDAALDLRGKVQVEDIHQVWAGATGVDEGEDESLDHGLLKSKGELLFVPAQGRCFNNIYENWTLK